MEHLKDGATWEYHVGDYVFHLRKEQGAPRFYEGPASDPDLTLYFTPEAVEVLSQAKDADTYYRMYRELMKSPQGAARVDYKLNKSMVKLAKMGYVKWARRYGFL